MHSKGNLRLRTQRIILIFKSMGMTAAVPPLVVLLVMPSLLYLSYRREGVSEALYVSILEITQVFLPFFCSWWIIFMMRNFVEAQGKETLYVNRYKNSVLDVTLIFGLYCLMISVPYAVFILLFPGMKLELVKMLMICFFVFGLTFFLAALTGSMPAIVLVNLFLVLINFLAGSYNSKFPIYYSLEVATTSALRTQYLPLAVLGGVFLLLGKLLIKRQALKRL